MKNKNNSLMDLKQDRAILVAMALFLLMLLGLSFRADATPNPNILKQSTQTAQTEKHTCKGTTKQGLPCKIKVKDGEYCQHHNPNARKCQGKRKDGQKCQMNVSKDKTYCHHHNNQVNK